MKRRRIKTWVKVLAIVLVGAAIYQLATMRSRQSTPVGEYTCRGGILKVCTGSKEVADYLGV